MEIKIHAQHLNLSPDQEARIKERFEKLTDYAHKIADEASTMRVDLIHEDTKNADEAYACNLTLFIPQDTLRAEARAGSLDNVIDEVIEKIKAPIERYKDKMNHISERHQ